MNYEAIFVDWEGTLSNSRFWERWRDDPAQAEKYTKIQSALFESAVGKNMVNKWMIGSRKYKSVLEYVAEETALPYEDLENELRYSAENMKFIDDNVLTTIKRLRDIGKLVVIATDNMDTFSDWTVPALKLDNHFDDVLNSSTIRWLKSDICEVNFKSHFFQRYLNDMGIAPQNSVLIDDSENAKCLERLNLNVLQVTAEQPLAYHLDMILNDS